MCPCSPRFYPPIVAIASTSVPVSVPYFVGLERDCCKRYCVTERSDGRNTTLDKRQHNRYRLAATVSFSWEADDHRVNRGQGHTRDCSLSGAFIVSPDKLPIGSILQMDFALPRLLAAGPGARLRTKGRVVRTEPDGFAVLTEIGPGSLLHRDASTEAVDVRATKR